MAKHELDTTGTVCPMPAFKTQKLVKTLDAGDVLTVTGDFPEALENVIRVATNNGCEVLEQHRDSKTFKVVVRKI